MKSKNIFLGLDVLRPRQHADCVSKKDDNDRKREREAQLAQALRANLRRRKASDRAVPDKTKAEPEK